VTHENHDPQCQTKAIPVAKKTQGSGQELCRNYRPRLKTLRENRPEKNHKKSKRDAPRSCDTQTYELCGWTVSSHAPD